VKHSQKFFGVVEAQSTGVVEALSTGWWNLLIKALGLEKQGCLVRPISLTRHIDKLQARFF